MEEFEMPKMRTRWYTAILLVAILLVLLVACGRDNRDEEAPAAAAPAAAIPAVEGPAAEATTVAPAAQTEATAAPEVAQPAASGATTDTAGSGASGGAAGGDAATIVTNAMAAQVSSGPYRATTVVNADGTVTEMVSEVAPPDQMHVVIGGGNMELVLLGEALWSKTSDQPWVQMGSPEMMQGIFDTIEGQVDNATITNVQYGGSEPVMGEATDVYSFTSALADGTFSSDVKLWISTASGLPVRMESTSVAAGVTTTVVQTIEYDSSITIEAPTP
jgi:hypothetical protein